MCGNIFVLQNNCRKQSTTIKILDAKEIWLEPG